MKENKSVQYTFGPEEKEILDSMSSFEGSLESGENEKNSQIRYYNNFTFNGKTIDGLKNIFIVIEKDEKGEIIGYDLYTPDMKKILSADSEGKIIESINDLEKTLGKIDILEVIKENELEVINEKGQKESKLKGISDKAEPEDIEKTMRKQTGKEYKNEQKEKERENPEEQVEKDLGGEENLEISYYRKIEDSNLDEQMKKDFSGYEEKGIAYSKTKNAFIMVGKKDGKFQMVDGFEPARPTLKTVMSIDEKGKKVEKKVPHALMKTNNPKKEMSITIGQYGYIEAGTVDRLPCDRRIEMQVQEAGETSAGRTERTLASAVKAEGTQGLHNWAEEHEEMLEKMENGEIVEKEELEEEISNGGEHIYTEEEEKLIENAAKNRAHMSVKGFKDILKEIPENKDIETRINDAVEVAEEQARGSIEY